MRVMITNRRFVFEQKRGFHESIAIDWAGEHGVMLGGGFPGHALRPDDVLVDQVGRSDYNFRFRFTATATQTSTLNY